MELRQYLEVIRRRRWVALTAFVVSTAVTLSFVLPQPSVYKSTGTLVIGPRYVDREEAIKALETLSNGEAITATYASIAGSDLIRRRATARLDTSFQTSDLTVDAEVMLGTNVLSFSVRGDKPEPVRALAEAIAAETVAYVDELDGAYGLKPLDPPDLTSEGAGLSKALTIALGIAFGAMLGVGLALLGDYVRGTTLASWSSRAESPTGLLNGLNIIDPEEYLRIFWQEVDLATGSSHLTFGILHVALRDEQKNELSYDLRRSHLTRIAELLEPDLGYGHVLTYLGQGTLAVMLPDTPVAEAERLLSAWKAAIASISDGTDGETTSKLEVSTGLLTSLITVTPQPAQVPSSYKADELSSSDNASDMSRAYAKRAWAWH